MRDARVEKGRRSPSGAGPGCAGRSAVRGRCWSGVSQTRYSRGSTVSASGLPAHMGRATQYIHLARANCPRACVDLVASAHRAGAPEPLGWRFSGRHAGPLALGPVAAVRSRPDDAPSLPGHEYPSVPVSVLGQSDDDLLVAAVEPDPIPPGSAGRLTVGPLPGNRRPTGNELESNQMRQGSRPRARAWRRSSTRAPGSRRGLDQYG